MNYDSLYKYFMQTKTVSSRAKMVLKQYQNVDPFVALQDIESLAQVFRQRVEEHE